MLRPLIQRPRRSAARRRRERGVTIALVALAMVAIIAMAALSIDVGTLYQASAEAQKAADAAALAGARVLSLSGMTGDPKNSTNNWLAACASATQIATAVANQNNVGGKAPSSVNVTFLSSDQSNCGSSGGAFGINPMVTVQVVQASLPTYFSRIWGRTGSSVSASATAEVFNPSNSDSEAAGKEVVPVQPRCVKPIIVPNLDPGNPNNPANCTTNCLPFVKNKDGSIQNPGFFTSGSGVIGETFNLVPDCSLTGACNSVEVPPHFANPPAVVTGSGLQYVPGLSPATSAAVRSCANGADAYQQAVAGCDQSTAYQCGVPNASLGTNANQVDLSENPGIATSDTSTAVECLIHQASKGGITGQDSLNTGVYPFQIIAGTGNPLNVSGSVITSSNSIVSIPIYDGNFLTITGSQAPVTIVGFLQVFINQINAGTIDGSLLVTVLNVAGCGNAVPSGTPYLTGTSPAPVRLITPPPPSS